MDSSDRLRTLLNHTGLSQSEFAEKLGISKGQISNILSGERGITNLMALALKAEFSVNPNWLLTGEGEMFLNHEKGVNVIIGDNNIHGSNNTIYHLNRDEKELIDTVRQKKLIPAIKKILGLGE